MWMAVRALAILILALMACFGWHWYSGMAEDTWLPNENKLIFLFMEIISDVLISLSPSYYSLDETRTPVGNSKSNKPGAPCHKNYELRGLLT